MQKVVKATLNEVDFSEEILSINCDTGDYSYAPLAGETEVVALKSLKLKGQKIELKLDDCGHFISISRMNEEEDWPSLPLGKKFNSYKSQKIFGPPGTGKTTTLIKLVEDAIAIGIEPNDIAFISFSNGAANVAKGRVKAAMPQYGAIDFPNFSTMHSLATRVGGANSSTLMEEEHFHAFDPNIKTWQDWTQLGDPLGLSMRLKHPILDKYSLALARCEPFDYFVYNDLDPQSVVNAFRDIAPVLKEKYEDLKAAYSALKKSERQPYLNELVRKYLISFNSFKAKHKLIGFDDVIQKVSSEDFPDELIPTFELLIVDEAQDLTKNLWKFASKLMAKAKNAYIAGDDDQAIMQGIGASPETFVELKTTEIDNPLEQSFRIPKSVRDYLDKGVMKRLEKLPNRSGTTWQPNDKKGEITIGFRGVEVMKSGKKSWMTREFTPQKLVSVIESEYKRFTGKADGYDFQVLQEIGEALLQMPQRVLPLYLFSYCRTLRKSCPRNQKIHMISVN